MAGEDLGFEGVWADEYPYVPACWLHPAKKRPTRKTANTLNRVFSVGYNKFVAYVNDVVLQIVTGFDRGHVDPELSGDLVD